MFRRLFVLAIGIVVMLALAGVVAAQGMGKESTSSAPEGCPMNFSDVPPGSTFYPYVLCLYCRA